MVLGYWMLWFGGGEWTDSVSDDENWILELRRGIWREPFNGADGPFVRNVTEAVVRMRPQKTRRAVRTQVTRSIRLGWGWSQRNE